MKITQFTLSFLVAFGVLSVRLDAQAAEADKPTVEQDLKTIVDAATRLGEGGKTANSPVRRLRRKNRPVRYFIDDFRSKLKKKPGVVTDETSPEKRSEITKKLKADAKLLVEAAGRVHAKGQKVSPKIDAALDGTKGDFARHALVSLDTCIWADVAKKAIEPFKGKGSYEGMFAEFLPHREKMLTAFMRLFFDGGLELTDRDLAANGIVEMGKKGDKETLARLTAVANDTDEEGRIRQTAAQVMYRLGDPSIIMELAKPHVNRLAQAQYEYRHADDPRRRYQHFIAIQQLNGNLAQIYQGAHAYANAARYHIGQLQVSYGISDELLARDERLKNYIYQSASSATYNLACVLSRLGMVDEAHAFIDDHFSWGGNLFDWARKDGDLAAIRKADPEGFEKLVTAFEKGERKPSRPKMEQERFTSALKKVPAFTNIPKVDWKPKPKPKAKPEDAKPDGKPVEPKPAEPKPVS